MIENTDDEQIERLNSRIIELLRERDALVKALIGLNDAIDLYWKEGRTDGQVKNIAYWQFKSKEALASIKVAT